MKSFFDDLESQLRAAARSRTDADPAGASSPLSDGGDRRRSSGRAWLRSSARATPVLLAVATTVAIAVAALLLLGHRHRPPPSSPAAGGNHSSLAWIFGSTPTRKLRRELYYINLATQRAQQAHPHLCSPRLPPRTSFIHGAPHTSLLSVLAVLRRPQTGADRRGKQSLSGVPDVYVRTIRRAFVADGVSYFLAVARNEPSAFQPSPRCFAFELTAMQAVLPQIPRSLRAATIRLQSTLIAFDRRTIYGGPKDTLCMASVSRNSGGSECGLTAAQIVHGVTPSDDNGTFSGIVPNDVATVTVTWQAPHEPQQSGTATVQGNMYAVRAVPDNANNLTVTVVWRSAQGKVLKTISQPSPMAVVRYCRRHRAQCLAGAGLHESSSSSSNGGGFTGTSYAPAPYQMGSSSSSSSSATATTASSSSSGG